MIKFKQYNQLLSIANWKFIWLKLYCIIFYFPSKLMIKSVNPLKSFKS
jgi:hypothetical protein